MSSADDHARPLLRPLGRIPSGLYVLSAAHAGRQCAMLASWVQQAAFDPPAITVSLARDRQAVPLIRESGHFALAILAADNSALLRRYARETLCDERAFADLPTKTTPAGLTIPAEALGYLDCQVLQWIDFSADHLLIVARITAEDLMRDARPFIHLRGAGTHY